MFFLTGSCALFYASRQGHCGLVDALLKARADPNAQSQPLVYAAKLGHNTEVRSVLSLLRAGADVDAQDAHGKTALMYAALNSHGSIVKALLEDDVRSDEMNLARLTLTHPDAPRSHPALTAVPGEVAVEAG